MGNAKSSYGKLSIVLDLPLHASSTGAAYVAGQTLSGSVYAQSKSNIPSSSQSSQPPLNLSAYLSGKERSRVRYTETEHYTSNGESKTRTVTKYSNSKRDLIHLELRLGNVSNSVAAGAMFRFPFRISLPADLPGSMYCKESSGGGGHCEIIYKIKAELKGSGRFGGSHKVDQVFTVLPAPLPSQPMPNLINPVENEIRFCCCFKVGTITMGARVENTRIGRGESVSIDFACKNQSLRGIDRAEAKIVEEARWTASGRSNNSKNVIVSETFQSNQRWEKLSKVDFKELQSMAKGMPSSFQDQKQSMLRSILAAIYDEENRAILNVPRMALQTYQGVLIQVTHHLKIKIYTSGSCTDNPKIILPIYIGTPPSLLGGPHPTLSSQPTQQFHSTQPAFSSSPPVAVAIPVIPTAPPLSSSTVPTAAMPTAPPAEWAGAVTATPVIASGTGAVLGGSKIWTSEGNFDNDAMEDNIPMAVAELAPTLPNLLREIEYAVSPIETVRKRLGQDSWRDAVFAGMSPAEYASVLRAVAIEFDQPDMAALIAPAIKGGNFTHEYVVAALRAVANWLRTPLVVKLLPLCKDLERNAGVIKGELSDWERVCTERDFEQALNG